MSGHEESNSNNHRKDSLNAFNNEFIETLNELIVKKKKLVKKINKEKIKLCDLEKNLSELLQQKNHLETSVKKKEKSLATINNTITNTKSAHEKIIEASHVLLTIIKKNKQNIKE